MRATAPTTAPPPKNVAHTLALAEFAQQTSTQAHSQSFELPTLLSALPSQEASNFQDSLDALIQISSEEEAGSGCCVTPASTYPITSGPKMKQQPLDCPVTITNLSNSAKTSTLQETPNIPLYKCPPLLSSPGSVSPTRKGTERQNSVATEIPVQANSSSKTPAATHSGSFRHAGVLPQTKVSHMKSYLCCITPLNNFGTVKS